MSEKLVIEPAKSSDAADISRFVQPIYQAVYPNEKYGLRPEDFAEWIFETEDTLDYFREIATQAENHVSYVARIGEAILGTAAVTKFEDHYEPRCFYVGLEHQGQGIGSALWQKVMEFCREDLPIRVEVAETVTNTIKLYESWGFEHRPELGVNMRHWPEWPDDVSNGYIYLEKPNKRD